MSELNAYQWNSVVVGRWNPAILTPKGIAKYIFEKDDAEPFEVLVPIDAAEEPLRIKIDGLLVQANFERLSIECETCDYASIEKASDYCCKAIMALPITPLSAAGFNLRFRFDDPDGEFIELLGLPLDDKISDQQLTIVGRDITRSLDWNNGKINMKIRKVDTNKYTIGLNFHKKSTDNEELIKWLSVPKEGIKNIADTILCDILNICNREDV